MQKDPRFEVNGTAFVLFFHPFCDAHQQGDGKDGYDLRRSIEVRVGGRFLEVASRVLQRDGGRVDSTCKIDLCHNPRHRVDNGELSFWLDGMVIAEETAAKLVRTLRESLEREPVKVSIDGEEFTVRFCGCGYRLLPAAKHIRTE